MYQRILVPLDGSELAEQVLPYARALSKSISARLDLIRVIQPPPGEWANSAEAGYPQSQADSLKESAWEYLEELGASLR